MSQRRIYYATEFRSIKPTTSFRRALQAAEREADRRQCASELYKNGRLEMIVYPAQRTAR